MIKLRGTCSWSAQMRTNYGENLSDYPQNGGDICNWKGVGAAEAGGGGQIIVRYEVGYCK